MQLIEEEGEEECKACIGERYIYAGSWRSHGFGRLRLRNSRQGYIEFLMWKRQEGDMYSSYRTFEEMLRSIDEEEEEETV